MLFHWCQRGSYSSREQIYQEGGAGGGVGEEIEEMWARRREWKDTAIERDKSPSTALIIWWRGWSDPPPPIPLSSRGCSELQRAASHYKWKYHFPLLSSLLLCLSAHTHFHGSSGTRIPRIVRQCIMSEYSTCFQTSRHNTDNPPSKDPTARQRIC